MDKIGNATVSYPNSVVRIHDYLRRMNAPKRNVWTRIAVHNANGGSKLRCIEPKQGSRNWLHGTICSHMLLVQIADIGNELITAYYRIGSGASRLRWKLIADEGFFQIRNRRVPNLTPSFFDLLDI